MNKYSLIIPCFNEEKNLPLLVDSCSKLLSNPEIEVVLVNNGSTDNSLKIMLNFSNKYHNLIVVNIKKNIGYGHGIIMGLQKANGNVLSWTHADLQTNPNDLIEGFKLFDSCDTKNAFVKGERYGRKYSDVFFTIGMSFFESILLKKKLWDINAQPTIFSKEFFLKWKNPPNDFSLDLYAYYFALNENFKIKRFKVFFGKRAHGVSNWNVDWKSKIKFIKRTLDFSFKLNKKLKNDYYKS